MARRVITNPASVAALNSVEQLWTAASNRRTADCFEIDLGDVSSLDYYTGSSLKMFVHGAGTSVAHGGRYDGLTGNFGCAQPAVGFVFNLDALTKCSDARWRTSRSHKEAQKQQICSQKPFVFCASLWHLKLFD